AVFILDSNGRIIFVNAAGERLVAQHDGVSIEEKTLHLGTLAETGALRGLIADAVKARDSAQSRGGGAMRCERPSGQRIELLVSPAPRTNDILGAPTPVAVVFVNDATQPIEHNSRVLQMLYRFTDTECAVVMHAVRGAHLQTIATAL